MNGALTSFDQFTCILIYRRSTSFIISFKTVLELLFLSVVTVLWKWNMPRLTFLNDNDNNEYIRDNMPVSIENHENISLVKTLSIQYIIFEPQYDKMTH